MDYSLYDARKAGFSRVVFLIRQEMQEVFDQQVGRKYANKMEVEYAYQKVDDLPEGTDILIHREKPWGTGHAVWCARTVLAGSPFAVINADDFYGAATFSALIDSISSFFESIDSISDSFISPIFLQVSTRCFFSSSVNLPSAQATAEIVRKMISIVLLSIGQLQFSCYKA